LAGGEKSLISLAKFLESRGHVVSIYSLPISRRPERVAFVNHPFREGWQHSVDADVAYFIYAPFVWRFFNVKCPKIAGLHSFIVDPVGASDGLDSMPIWNSLRFLGPRLTVARRYFNLAKATELSSFNAIHTLTGLTMHSHPNVFQIPQFVDREKYRPVSEKNERFTVLFASRGDWTKGIPTFLETANILQSSKYEFELAGGLAVESPGVRNLGFLSDEDLVHAYSGAHCVVLPSRIDVCSNTILESMACGTPVITTPLTTHKIVRLPLIYAQSAEQMAQQLKMLHQLWSEHRDDYTSLSQRARIATAEYDVEVIGPKYEEMLESVSEGVRHSREPNSA
jgi:glycosyltransferase involved in cell wall biosynthesis